MKLLIKTDTPEFYFNYLIHHIGDSGIDIYFPEDVLLSPKQTKLVDLGLSCEMKSDIGNPSSFFLVPRSSISKTPLRMSNSIGIIDAGYRGNLKVSLDNTSNEEYLIKKGSRLFQIVASNLENIIPKQVSELSETTRGAGGFGSTN